MSAPVATSVRGAARTGPTATAAPSASLAALACLAAASAAPPRPGAFTSPAASGSNSLATAAPAFAPRALATPATSFVRRTLVALRGPIGLGDGLRCRQQQAGGDNCGANRRAD